MVHFPCITNHIQQMERMNIMVMNVVCVQQCLQAHFSYQWWFQFVVVLVLVGSSVDKPRPRTRSLSLSKNPSFTLRSLFFLHPGWLQWYFPPNYLFVGHCLKGYKCPLQRTNFLTDKVSTQKSTVIGGEAQPILTDVEL